MRFYSPIALLVLLSCGQIKDSSITLKDVCSSTSSVLNSLPDVPIDKIDNEHIRNGDAFTTEGFMYLNMEDVAIYAKQTGNTYQKFWLNFSDSLNHRLTELKKLRGKKVRLSGKINFNKHGHLNDYLAEIDSVFCVKIIHEK